MIMIRSSSKHVISEGKDKSKVNISILSREKVKGLRSQVLDQPAILKLLRMKS